MDIQQIIDNKLYVGTLKKDANPKTRQYWASIQNNVVIIDPNAILSQLEEAKEKVQSFLKEWKEVLVISDKLIHKEEVEKICEEKGVHYFSYKVPSWVVTNFKTLYASIKKMNDLRKFIESEEFEKLTKKEQMVKLRQLRKMEFVYKGVKDLSKKPDLVIVLDGAFLSKFVDEIEKTGVAWVILASTDFNKWIDESLVLMNVNNHNGVLSVLRYLLW